MEAKQTGSSPPLAESSTGARKPGWTSGLACTRQTPRGRYPELNEEALIPLKAGNGGPERIRIAA